MKAKALPDGSANVTLRLRNAGKMTGDEVPQLCLDAPVQAIGGVQFAPRTLVAFDRVTLRPGESRIIAMHVVPRAFEYWSTQDKAWRRPEGFRTLHAGASSRDLRLSVQLH
jgi:beta-glucosidase